MYSDVPWESRTPPPTARLMKKYNLAKILRWRENDIDRETTRENGKERETKADKTFVNSDMQKTKCERTEELKGGQHNLSVGGRDICKRREGTIGHRVREATVRFGCDPRHVSWMAITCPRAATGDDCPASPQGAPLTPTPPTHTQTHTPLPRDLRVDEPYG